MKIATTFRLIYISVFIAVLFCITGCGRKGPPLPPVNQMLQPPTNLSVKVKDDKAILNWTWETDTDSSYRISGFQIFSSEINLAGDRCEDCPVIFTPAGDTDPETFNFSHPIKPGTRVYFRVRAFSENNNYSLFSNTIQVERNQ